VAFSLTPEARRRWAWRLAVALVVGYAAWLRLVILVERYGPFDHPGWLVTLSRVVEAPKPVMAPASWVWAKSDPPYVGGDPINYLKFARELPSFYSATVREPLFLQAIRFYFALTANQDVAISFASLTFSVLCVFATYLAGSVAISRPVGLAAAFALGIEQEFAAWAPDGWRDETFAAFVLLTAWALLRLRDRRTWPNAVLAGVVCAAACLTRITSISFVVPGLIWVAWPRERGAWRASATYAGGAALVTAVLVAPYLINCYRQTGDALIAINYHTRFYLAAEGTLTDAPPTALRYAAAKFRAHPIGETDTAVRGLVEFPFVTKFRGFYGWLPSLGPVLRWLSAFGLLIWIWQPRGRLLLLILLTSLAPYMITWTLRGGGEWRFTMHAYPFYLLAAFAAVAWLVAGVRSLIASRQSTLAAWRAQHVGAKGLATAALVAIGCLANFWAPYFVARESLLAGESTSVAAGDNDGVFFGAGWTDLVHSGMVTSRFANAQRATLRVPFPERRAYHVVLRMDAVPDANGSPQRVRLFIDNRPAGVFDLAWNEERVGALMLDLPASDVSPGRARLDFVADRVAPLGQAEASFPDLPASAPVAFRLWYVRLTPQ
jgi:4-amino-4-deoxy-L-arabinose transferase-like glycosyltransferase